MQYRILSRILAAGAVILSSSSAAAQNLVVNGSFELPGYQTPAFRLLSNGDNTTIAGWTVIDDGIGEKPYLGKAPSYTVGHGDYSLWVNQGSGVRTTFSAVAGTTYDLSFLFANAGTNPTLSPLEIRIGGAMFFIAPPAHTPPCGTPPCFSFTPHSFQFTAGVTDAATLLQFYNSSPVGDYRIYALDGVSITSAVPEPTTIALLSVGLLGICVSARRRGTEKAPESRMSE